MVTITNKKAAPITISYSVEGSIHEIKLISGVNKNVPDDHLEHIRNHPSFKAMLEEGYVDLPKGTPGSKGELGGFQVAENKVTDEPIPIVNAKVSKVA